MDQDLLEYLQAFRAENAKQFDALGQEVRSLREETERRFDGVDQEFRSVRGRFDEVDQEFHSIRGRFDGVDQEFHSVRGRFDGVDQEFHSVRGRFDGVDQEFHSVREENAQRFDKLETEVRRVHVVVENLQDVVQLVAEGVTTVSHQLQRQGEELSRRLDGVESFNRLLYKDLDSRVSRSRRPKV